MFPVRATVHRIAGAVMIGVSLLHVISLIASRRLREHWLEMWPRVGDAREGLLNLAYLLGLREQKPRLSSHGYVEKAEYWAVVWGTAVMALTGLLLWAVNYTLVWFPKSWLDVATAVHFYEAVLATLSIVVWHFYFVIFDPEVYPMDTAWLTGDSVRERASPTHAGSARRSRSPGKTHDGTFHASFGMGGWLVAHRPPLQQPAEPGRRDPGDDGDGLLDLPACRPAWAREVHNPYFGHPRRS